MSLTNFASGVKFEHVTKAIEIRSLVRKISRDIVVHNYGGWYHLAVDGEIFMDISEKYAIVRNKSQRCYTNKILAGLGTGIRITRDWMVDR